MDCLNQPQALDDGQCPLGTLSAKELEERLAEVERCYAAKILASPKGSTVRRELFREAYREVNRLLIEGRQRAGRLVDSFGFNPASIERMCELIGPAPCHVLDIGCGTGTMVEEMLKRGYQAMGIELSKELVEIGRTRMEREGLAGNSIIVGDFLTWETRSENVFDLVHTSNVLEHQHPDEALDFLRKCFHLLRPGGYLWLVTPNGLARNGIWRDNAKPHGLHLREYSLRELCAMLRAAGFDAIKSCLWTKGRFRRVHSRLRVGYTKVKTLLEPALACLPKAIRARLMAILGYAEVVAQKKNNAI
jgi:2-polyprenyl-3-methyl-5-hydroxy-6-metoxy-1,4-benzoquinol methylase